MHPPPTERCYWVLPGRLLAGAYPGSPDPAVHRARIDALYDAGMRCFVSLMEEHEPDGSGQSFAPYASHLEHRPEPVICQRFPIRDLSVPSVDGMRATLDAIDRSLDAQRPVYLHCFGGIGRTGTVVGCWLIRHGVATPERVLEVIAELRQADRERRSYASPENDAQRAFLRAWREAGASG